MHLNYSTRTKKGKTYRYYSIAESYRDENKVPRKRVIKSLGSLLPDEVERWKLLLSAASGKTEVLSLLDPTKMKFTDSKKYLDVALLSEIFDQLGLGGPFELIKDQGKDISVANIAKILILSRCLDPLAKYKTVDWFNDSYLPELMKINSSSYNKTKIFRELSTIHDRKDYLQKHLIRLANNISGNDKRLYFFDGTTSFFEGTSVEIASGAKDKTHGYQSKVILICLLTDQNGLPLAWDVASGNKKDVTEFIDVAKKLMDDAKINDVTFCFDRGVASKNNFEYIENTLKSKYISGINRDQISLVFNLNNFIKIRKALLEEYEQLTIKCNNDDGTRVKSSVGGFTRLGKDRFFRDLGVIKGKRYVASFNASIFHKEQSIRDENLQKIYDYISDLNLELAQAKKDRNDAVVEEKISSIIKKYKLQSIVNYSILPCTSKNKKAQTYKITYTVDKEALEVTGQTDGILVYVSNHIELNTKNNLYEVPASKIVQHYKDKYVIEDCFRSLKTFGDLRPFFVRKKEHINAHVDICMCSHFINRYMYLILRPNGISLSDFYSKIKKYSRVCKIEDGPRKNSFLRTIPKEMKEIIKVLNVKNIISKRSLKSLNIINN